MTKTEYEKYVVIWELRGILLKGPTDTFVIPEYRSVRVVLLSNKTPLGTMQANFTIYKNGDHNLRNVTFNKRGAPAHLVGADAITILNDVTYPKSLNS